MAPSPAIRVVWGAATGPTAVASYDAALADAGVHNYNLDTVSSIVPSDVPVEAVGTAPDLGPPGDRLTAVEARATVEGADRATAGIGWTRAGDGPGVFYEAAGSFPEAVAHERIERGLAAARDLRDWAFSEGDVRTVSVEADGAFATAVVLAVYGDGEPVV